MLSWWLAFGVARADPAIEHEGSVWMSHLFLVSVHEGGKGLALWLDLHGRASTSTGFLGVVRPAIGVDLGRGWSLWSGYAWIGSFAFNSPLVSEHRPWQQVQGGMQLGRTSLLVRGRLEERFRQGEQAVGLRARLMGRWAFDVAGPVIVVVTDEVFVGLNKPGWAPQGLDQNRAFLGVGLKASEPFRVETGYLNVLSNRTVDRMAHAVVLNLFVTPKVAMRRAGASVGADRRDDAAEAEVGEYDVGLVAPVP